MQTAIALFKTAQEAQRAVDRLTEYGYGDQEITLIQGGETSTAEKLMAQARIPEQDQQFYVNGLRNSGTLVLVRAEESRAQAAADLLTQFDMVNMDTRGTRSQAVGQNQARMRQGATDETVIPVVEEDIQIGKREVQRGGVRVRTDITERPVEEQVSLREEHVHVERRPVDRAATDADFTTFKEGEFELTETAEEAVVAKQARVIEEVVIGKDATERTETVRDSVRRTDVDVEQIEGQTRTTGSTDFATYDTDFRSYYDSTLANKGYTYEQYSPVFRYGYGLANDSRYRNKSWNDIESSARTDWEAKNPGTWEDFKDSVRYAWQRVTGQR